MIGGKQIKVYELTREDFNSRSLFDWIYGQDNWLDYLQIMGACTDHARRIKCLRWFRGLRRLYERRILMEFVREQYKQYGGVHSPAMKIIIPLINKHDPCRSYSEVD